MTSCSFGIELSFLGKKKTPRFLRGVLSCSLLILLIYHKHKHSPFSTMARHIVELYLKETIKFSLLFLVNLSSSKVELNLHRSKQFGPEQNQTYELRDADPWLIF